MSKGLKFALCSGFVLPLLKLKKYMSKITWSSIGITEARGSTGSTVHSRNRGGNYTRQRTIPNYPNSPEQQLIASVISTLNMLWQALGDNERADWNLFARDYPQKNSLGRVYISTGYNFFIRTNFNLALSGSVPVLLPPPFHSPAQILSFTIPSFSGTAITFSTLLSSGSDVVPANQRVLVFATPCVSSGRSTMTNYFNAIDRYNATEAVDGTGTIASYISEFGAPVVGKKVFVRLSVVSKISGQRTAWTCSSCIVT